MEVLHPEWPPLAPLFHYYVTRVDSHGADARGFVDLDVALLTLANQGICREQLHSHPYTPAGAAVPPVSDAYVDASGRRLQRSGLRPRYRALYGISRVVSIRDELKLDRPVVIGFTLPRGYPESFLDSTMAWIDPDASAPSASHHCALVLGYSDLRQALRVHDSRGPTRFGNGGWWMGYRVADSSLVQAAYTLFLT